MSKEKTLDEALDEMDGWSEKFVNKINSMSNEEVVKYLKITHEEYEKNRKRLKAGKARNTRKARMA